MEQMKKIFLFLLILTVAGFSQQINHTVGTNLAGTAVRSIVYLDTTAATTNEIYVDLDDWYPIDLNPAVYDSATALINSNLLWLGTFYVSFDNQGTGSPTTDSLAGITIKATPGIYTTASKSLASADWGSAITLETVRQAGDYFAINNVYVHATKYKLIPPELLRLQINAPAASDTDCDDSTAVYWKFSYPAIYHEHEVQKP